MTPREVISRIDAGANNYVRLFGEAAHMESVDNGAYRVIRPKPGERGIKFVCDVRPERLDRRTIRELKRLHMPVWWPLLMPDRLKFKPDVDLCMAILPGELISNDRAKLVQRVKNAEDFARWATFVNDTMYGGYPYVHPVHHWPLCERGAIRCYFIALDGQMAAAAAIEPDGADASLEFVATDPTHRRQGLASGVCAAAIADAFARGAELVTLRAGNEGARELYTSLGFKIYNEAI
jgi:ribosomal protein S18 acetylase RimI-like enzyme